MWKRLVAVVFAACLIGGAAASIAAAQAPGNPTPSERAELRQQKSTMKHQRQKAKRLVKRLHQKAKRAVKRQRQASPAR
jgi:hypothetical protein